MIDVNQIWEKAIEARIQRIKKRTWGFEERFDALQAVLSMIVLTSLEGSDTPDKIATLVQRAKQPSTKIETLPHTAAVCVYPNMVTHARQALGEESPIRIAAVATAFPSGQSSFEVKKLDTQLALDQGADEIDMVISRGRFLAGEENFVFDEIAAIKEICGDKTLKVILETGELLNLSNVKKASEIAIKAGADFIKTSTGKISTVATLPVSLVMLRTIKAHFDRTGVKIGMKPAGGISNGDVALQYLALVNEELGEEWLTKDLFRFGASSLVNDVVRQLEEFKVIQF